MQTINYTIKDREGIHARPAGTLVRVAKEFSSSVIMKKGDKEADCKKIFGIMGLCVKSGETVEINISGADEEKASQAVLKCLEENL